MTYLLPTYRFYEVLYMVHCFLRDKDIQGLQILHDVVFEERKRYSPFAYSTMALVFGAAWEEIESV